MLWSIKTQKNKQAWRLLLNWKPHFPPRCYCSSTTMIENPLAPFFHCPFSVIRSLAQQPQSNIIQSSTKHSTRTLNVQTPATISVLKLHSYILKISYGHFTDRKRNEDPNRYVEQDTRNHTENLIAIFDYFQHLLAWWL